jgi:LysM repeat protein/ABC-type branched-subunit amino acid transport system substrate-binding protein
MEKALRFLIFTLIILLHSCFFAIKAQKDNPLKNKSDKIEIINGKKYYLHTVLKKQTLYAISKSYEVTIDTILAVNPEAKQGIKTDQILMIPVMGEKKETVFHKVAAQETLYAISKQYNLEVADLIKANPELSNSLKEGQIIIIPEKTIKTNNKIPEKKDNSCTPVNSDKAYNVALMIPLYLEDIYKLDLGEIKVVEKFKKNKSFTFIAFYEGVLMALDSLQQTGLSVNLFVYDVEKDTNKVAVLLEKPEIKTMDMIIGPFFNETLKKVVAYAKPLNINVISPLSFDNILLKSNSNVFQAMPSQYTQLESMAKYIIKNYPANDIIIVHNGIEKDLKTALLLEKILDSLTLKKPENKIYKEVNYSKDGLAGVKKYFSEEKENIIITFSSDEVFIMNYVRNLSALTDKNKIILFGLPHWRSFENIETDYLMKLNLHLTSTCFIDYENPNVINLIRKYREQYYSEPDRYVFQGFDEAFYFLSILKTYGKDFENCISSDTIVKYEGLSTHFKFNKPINDNGSENNYVTIYKYEDFKLVQVTTKG